MPEIRIFNLPDIYHQGLTLLARKYRMSINSLIKQYISTHAEKPDHLTGYIEPGKREMRIRGLDPSTYNRIAQQAAETSESKNTLYLRCIRAGLSQEIKTVKK